MDIKKILRNALFQTLLESKHKNKSHKNEFGCVMLYLDLDMDKWTEMLDVIADEDLYIPDDDPSYGKENEPHITVLFGLHNDIPDSDIENEINLIKKPKFSFKTISVFKNDKFEVLKFDVKGKDLHKINKEFKKFPNTNSYPDYHPHCTIAYLKPNTSDKYIKKLNDYLNLSVNISHIVYSKSNGVKLNYNF